MRLFGLIRRRRNRTGRNANPTWQDNMPARASGPGSGRYLALREIDRWRAAPYDMPPAPERGTVLQRVRQLTESLEGAIDEGAGASLDRLIEAWTASWIATVEAEYTDHCAVIGVHRGQAVEWLTESTHIARHEREELDRIRGDHLACRGRLTGGDADGDAEAAAGWSDPHLVAGRSMIGLALAGALVLMGALTDTIAFKNILELVLSREAEWVSWLMAAGATSMALVSAGSLGVAIASRRRGGRRSSPLPLAAAAAVWLGLGLAMFLVRWQDPGGSAAPVFGGAPAPARSTVWVAVFFAAIYLISGACTMFEAERLYNPEFFALRRLARQHRRQAARAAAAEATLDRAQAAVDLHDGEFDREDERRVAAIAERQALGAEAANHARILMAAMLRDPAKTGITETGPVPELPSGSSGPTGLVGRAAIEAA